MIVTDPTEYRESKAISFSWLKRFEADPDAFYRRFVLGEKPDTEEPESRALAVGTAAHCYVLEGREEFSRRFVVHPPTYPGRKGEEKPWNRNAKICSGWEEAKEDAGQAVVSPKEMALLGRLRDSVAANAEATRLLTGATMEIAIRRSYRDLPFQRQGRLDFINHAAAYIGDIKTIANLNDRGREIERRLYYRQLAYYVDLADEEFAQAYTGGIVWLEKEWPYRCTVETLSPHFIGIGRLENLASLTNLAECYTRGVWDRIPEAVAVGPSLELQLRAIPKNLAVF